MNPFKKKSTWDKVGEAARGADPKALARTGLTAVGALAGVTVASAVVSAVRERVERS